MEKEVYCTVCEEVTPHSPHPNDVACGGDYIVCDKCNRHRA